MPLSINDAGAWRDIQAVSVNDAGTWRDIQEIYVNDAGTWRSVFQNATISIANVSVLAVSAILSPSAQYWLQSNGIIAYNNSGTNNVVDQDPWITPQTNMANFEVRATLNSGALTSGTVGAWQSLSTTRQWVTTRNIASGSGSSTANLTIEIRRASDAVVVDTATISLQALVP
jgi:hypothetical protein